MKAAGMACSIYEGGKHIYVRYVLFKVELVVEKPFSHIKFSDKPVVVFCIPNNVFTFVFIYLPAHNE